MSAASIGARACRAANACLLAVAVLAMSGCIVVPVDHEPGEGFVETGTLVALRQGGTSRADVLMRLGEPDRRYLDDRAFAYRWTEMLALVLVGGPAPGAVGGFDISETRVLLVEFGADGVLRRADVVHGLQKSTLEDRIREWLEQVHD